MDSAAKVQIIDEAVYILYSTNNLRKGMQLFSLQL